MKCRGTIQISISNGLMNGTRSGRIYVGLGSMKLNLPCLNWKFRIGLDVENVPGWLDTSEMESEFQKNDEMMMQRTQMP